MKINTKNTRHYYYVSSKSIQRQRCSRANPNYQRQFTSRLLIMGSDSLAGDWVIVKNGDDHYLQLNENFNAKKGPDVKVLLSPLKRSDITGDNAAEGSLFIVLLENFEGASQFKIPSGTNISDYQSLVFHCLEYSKLWGTSALR